LLEVEDLTVSFDGFRAVDGLSLSVARNELRVVIGPNGAGKTTLLDMICGKTRPSNGRIRFGGHDLISKAEHEITRLGVGRKFQTPSTYEDLTVVENLELSYPRHRGVVSSFFFTEPRRCSGAWTRWPRRSIWTTSSRPARVGCRMDRSSGWRLACCSCRTRSSCCSTSRWRG